MNIPAEEQAIPADGSSALQQLILIYNKNMITSTQNKKIKELALLKNKKNRDQSGLFLIEGAHMIEEAAKAGILKMIYAEDSSLLDFLDPALLKTLQIEEAARPVLDKLSVLKSGSSLIGVCEPPKASGLSEINPQKVLLLDRVQDPGNVGTLIRSAAAFGAEAVILSPDCADPWNPKTLQSSQGASFLIPVLVMDLNDAVDTLKESGIPLYAAALHHESIELHTLKPQPEYGIMIGNEGQGISEELIQLCDHTLYIEMKTFESLNAAIAGSIILYHLQS